MTRARDLADSADKDITGTLTVDSLTVNRPTGSGTIIDVQKAGSSVGTIAEKDGEITIGSGDVGLRFYAAGDAVIPVTSTNQEVRDNAIDLGGSSFRFKDGYFNGSVYTTYVKGNGGHTGQVHFTGSHDVRFVTNGNERMRIDASGRVTMPNQPMASAQNGSTSTAATQVLDNFSTVRNNIGNHFNNSTGTFTCPVAGRYEINYHTQSNYAGAYNWLAIFHNSGVFDSLHWNPGPAAGHWQCSLSSIINCAANDTLAVGVQNVNNASTALISDSFVSFKLLG